MPKPKKRFSANLGGNSSAADIQAYQDQEAQKAQAQAPAKEKPKPRPVVQPPLPFGTLPPAYDFRALSEPEKTLQRVRAFLSDPRFTHGERTAGALLLFEFQGKEDTQIISVKKLLSDSRGFSSTIRDKLLAKMSEKGLLRAQWLRGIGTEITLMF